MPVDAAEYSLEQHVYACFTNDFAILLDLRNDQYIGLAKSQVQALSPLVRGWPAPTSLIGSSGQIDGSAIEFADHLCKRGLLTRDAIRGKPASAPASLACEDSLFDKRTGLRPNFRFHHLFFLLTAWIYATVSLNCFPLERVVRAANRRRASLPSGLPKCDMARLRELTETFHRLRLLFYSPLDRCLLDSFTFVTFLRFYRMYPVWVFGVTPNPFEAHSWVQYERMALNDTTVRIHRFIPILTI
jgi:hypothetical protein